MHLNRGKLYEFKGLPVVLVSVWKRPKSGCNCTVHVLAGHVPGSISRWAWARQYAGDLSWSVWGGDLKRIKKYDLPLYLHLPGQSDLFLKLIKGE